MLLLLLLYCKLDAAEAIDAWRMNIFLLCWVCQRQLVKGFALVIADLRPPRVALAWLGAIMSLLSMAFGLFQN